MTTDRVRQALLFFARAARMDRRANASEAGEGTALELLLAPHFRTLVESVLADRMPAPPQVLPEYRKQGLGRPDLAFARDRQAARSFIELKEPGKALDTRRWRGHDGDQFKRFSELPFWALCNFHTLQLYRRGELQQQVVVLPAAALDPAMSDSAAERLIGQADVAAFSRALELLALEPPMVPRTAAEMALNLAHAARLVREVVLGQCRIGVPSALRDVRAEFRETLFAHAAQAGYDVSDEDALFANAFAQTLAFGLMLARDTATAVQVKEAAKRGRLPEPVQVDRDAYRRLSDGIYPLLRATLRALTQDEVLDLLGIAFDVVLDAVNTADPQLLQPRTEHDPILYFYEDFLAVFDPVAKKRHGVFFTPVPIVRYMVAATERALRYDLGTHGLLDPSVLLLDPACGTGTFLVAAMTQAAAIAAQTWGQGAVAREVQALALRLHGLELLVGPYTVAHYRMLREVAVHGDLPDRRLPIYLADTLTPPLGATGITPHLGYMAQPIRDERRAADTLKRDTRILVIIGNPPYRRLQAGEEDALIAGWDNGFWDDLKQPVRDAGWGGELNTFPDLYIAFWRWCIWKLFECDGAPGRGIVCLITNRTFLAGHPYAGLRQMLRRRFDRIDIVDLRGDSRGARPAGIEADENVFAIQAGVCIVTAVAAGFNRPAEVEASVLYSDVWRHSAFANREKLMLMERGTSDPSVLTFSRVAGRGLDILSPRPFEGLDWVSTSGAFLFGKSGSKTQRDDLVYALREAEIRQKIEGFRIDSWECAWRMFFPTGVAEDLSWANPGRDDNGNLSSTRKAKLKTFRRARVSEFTPAAISRRVYRPMDTRYLYASPLFVSRYGPELERVWGAQNMCLYALPSGTGAGPAIWVHGLMPDYHAFRGSFGGYAFPLWDRRHGPDAHNLSPALLGGLAAAYGRHVSPEDTFDTIAALLSARTYTSRFAWDLQEAFARIPFPANYATFQEAAWIGSQIRELQTFAREPAAGFRSASLVGRPTGTTLGLPQLGRAFVADGSGSGFVPLQGDQSLRMASLPERVWRFAVSGYAVLPRWLDARRDQPLDAALQRAMLDVAWRIEELLHWFEAADPVLAAALDRPLTRAELGLASQE